jgi:hypothetical protein
VPAAGLGLRARACAHHLAAAEVFLSGDDDHVPRRYCQARLRGSGCRRARHFFSAWQRMR